MIGAFLFLAFLLMLLAGVPIGVALLLAGAAAIEMARQSLLAMPTNVYAGIAKQRYPGARDRLRCLPRARLHLSGCGGP